MIISDMMETYTTISSSDPHGFATDLLALHLGIYGKAVEEIELRFYWEKREPVAGSARSQYEDFQKSIDKLPRVKFVKKERRIEVESVSANFFAEDKNKKPSKTDLKRGCQECLLALESIATLGKIAPETLNVEEMLQDARRILNQNIPDAAERKKIREQSRLVSRVAHANSMDFDFLVRIDESWALFHRNAKALLAAPIFWTPDLKGPHGTETGIGVLLEFARWNVTHSRTSPLKFLQQLLQGWKLESLGKKSEAGLPVTSVAKSVLKWNKESPELLDQTNQIAIALAFAVYKLRGSCPEEILKMGRAAVKRQRILQDDQKAFGAIGSRDLSMLEIALKSMAKRELISAGAAKILKLQEGEKALDRSPKQQLDDIDFSSDLQYCYEDLQPLLGAELNKLRTAFAKLPSNASNSRKLNCVEKCVAALNAISRKKSVSSLDTDEREILCNFIYQMGSIVGLDAEADYIDKWREW